MNLSVSMSLCLSVSLLTSQKSHWPNFKFFCVWTVAVTQSFSDCTAIRYVLPVCGWRHVFLWWKLLHRFKPNFVIKTKYSSSIAHWVGAKFAVYDCRVLNGEMAYSSMIDSCVKSWQYFRTHNISLNSVSNWLSYDIVRFKIEVGIDAKCMYKKVTLNTREIPAVAAAKLRRHIMMT